MPQKQTKKKASNGDKKTKRVPSKKKKINTKRVRCSTPWTREYRNDDIKKMAMARNSRFEARQANKEINSKREPIVENDVVDSENSEDVDLDDVVRRVIQMDHNYLPVEQPSMDFDGYGKWRPLPILPEDSENQKTSLASDILETSTSSKTYKGSKNEDFIADVGIQDSGNVDPDDVVRRRVVQILLENVEIQKTSTASGNEQEKEEEDVTSIIEKREIEDNADSKDVKMEADDETVKIEDVEDVDTSEVQPLESMNLLQLLELLHKILLTLDSPFLKEIAEKFQKSMGKTRNSRKIPMETAISALDIVYKLSIQRYSTEDVNQKTSISNHEILTLLKNTCLFLNSHMTSNLLNDIKIAKKNSEKKIPVRNVQIALETALLLINP
ncbi:hypothetical protein B9Z55_017384 [Caenorhabditis nigoni]|uniref:SPK domain-containing protein n=1 Tax=Caenorhabditis nigoni TaxID=1611254 RepID=A0A2G5T9Q8_9PELO|nr:hypothetical protein B9Z55_017384 [Caenorhabditis nigoni]